MKIWYKVLTLIIIKGYEVRATTIEGRNAFAPSLALRNNNLEIRIAGSSCRPQ